ncbi:MAG: beta-CASP ribonuclease aCPSF1 [Candidatus Nanoarchaeia archaeon]|nr:beta-CASP ribonuclease aCPSF1 [Candidatus Nanoarchaeia archaeon]
MTTIIDEILKHIPDKKKISDTAFEAANIILYTKDSEFLMDDKGSIRDAVNSVKKRIELRPDPAITMDIEKAEEKIKEILPKDALIAGINFDPQRSRVIIEAEKPGLAIGKQGELLRTIKEKTLWVPIVRRSPALRSKIIENIRAVLYQYSDYRRKFLDKVGHRIYDGWTRGRQNEWVRVSFLGGARQVGRSCVFLQTPESRILLDCGVNVAASEQDQFPHLDAPEFKIDELDAVIISHSHLDHVGLLPYLYKMGYKGPTYCTAPTRDVSALLALDYIGVAFKEAKKGLFSSTDVKEMVKHTICLDYEEVSDITPDARITFYNAGHVLGSAITHMHIGNGLHNLIYTGDFKGIRTKLLEPAVTKFPRLETAIIEATYGAKTDIVKPRQECEEEFLGYINKTLERGGKILVPVLGVGRAQEIVVIIEEALRLGKIPKVPVFVQGLVWDVTAIHTAYPDFLNANIKKLTFHKDQNPFLSEYLKRVASRKEQEEVINEAGPCVIIATSGMMTSGASVSYFKALAEDARNTIIFVSYLGEGTLGRRIQSGDKHVTIPGEGDKKPIEVKLEIHTIPGMTGHAARDELMRFVHNLEPRPKKIIVNHGESSKCLDLASSIHKLERIETNAPKNLEAIRIR